ncbi:MAG: ComEC/Rec2 family competence protein [Planctomycetota bacterium]
MPLALAALAGAVLAPLAPSRAELWSLLALACGARVLWRPARGATPALLLGVALLLVARAPRAPEPLPRGVVRVRGVVEAVEASPHGPRWVVAAAGRRVRVDGSEDRRGPASIGAEVEVLGWGRPGRTRDDPLGFDEPAAFARAGLAGVVRAERVEVLAWGRGPGTFLACVRGALSDALRRGAPRWQPLLRAALLGEPLRGELRRDFARAGAAHLLSLSGLHVGLIAALALGGLRLGGLSPRAQRLGAAAVALVFLALVGPRPPLLRAAAAGVVALLLPGRGDAWNRLAAALVAVLWCDPGAPRDIGLQLSFGTVAGLIALGGLALNCRRWWTRAGAGALAGFAASAPLLAACVGQLPWIALVAAPVTIALFSLLLSTALVGAALGVLADPAGAPALWGADRLAEALVLLVRAAAAAAPAELLRPPHPITVALAAGLLGLGAVRREAGRSHRLLLAAGALLVLGWCVPTGSAGPAPARDDAVELQVLASGDGRTLLVVTPRGVAWAGREPSARWVTKALARSGAPRLDPGRLRRVRLPGGELICDGARRVLWVRDARDLSTLALPPLEVVGGGRLAPGAARALVWRARPRRLLGPTLEGVPAAPAPSIVSLDRGAR